MEARTGRKSRGRKALGGGEGRGGGPLGGALGVRLGGMVGDGREGRMRWWNLEVESEERPKEGADGVSAGLNLFTDLRKAKVLCGPSLVCITQGT